MIDSVLISYTDALLRSIEIPTGATGNDMFNKQQNTLVSKANLFISSYGANAFDGQPVDRQLSV